MIFDSMVVTIVERRNFFANFDCCYCCSLYDHVFRPNKFPGNADFHLFKAGIEPKWEDIECANGGKWTVISSRKETLDTMWRETVNFFFLHLVFIVVESVVWC